MTATALTSPLRTRGGTRSAVAVAPWSAPLRLPLRRPDLRVVALPARTAKSVGVAR